MACENVLLGIRRVLIHPGGAPDVIPSDAVLTESQNTQVTVGAASISVLAANTNRRHVTFVNTHATQTVYLSFGSASDTGHFPLPPGASFTLEINDLGEIFTGQIFGYASGANTILGVLEFDK